MGCVPWWMYQEKILRIWDFICKSQALLLVRSWMQVHKEGVAEEIVWHICDETMLDQAYVHQSKFSLLRSLNTKKKKFGQRLNSLSYTSDVTFLQCELVVQMQLLTLHRQGRCRRRSNPK